MRNPIILLAVLLWPAGAAWAQVTVDLHALDSLPGGGGASASAPHAAGPRAARRAPVGPRATPGSSEAQTSVSPIARSRTPQSQPPQAETARTETPPGQSPPGQAPMGQTSPGQTSPGQTSPGQTPPGQTSPGQTSPGQTATTQAPGMRSPGTQPSTIQSQATPGPATPGTTAQTPQQQGRTGAPQRQARATATQPALPTEVPPTAELTPIAPLPPSGEPAPPPPPVSATANTEAMPTGGGLRVTFGPTDAELNPDSVTSIRQFTGTGKSGDTTYNVLAYAAGSANDPSAARRLSLSRALAVRSALMADGVSSSRIFVRALGSAGGNGPADRVDINRLGGNSASARTP